MAEDNKGDIYLIEEALTVHGVNATLHVVPDGEAAIDYLQQAEADGPALPPHLVLLDLNLPRKTGHDVLRHIRKSARFGGLPVLIVTSSDAEIDRTQAQILGVSGFFRKPSNFDEYLKIGELVRQVLAPPAQ